MGNNFKALVHSVPGSGTRFVCEFTEECLGYKRAHTEIDLIESPVRNVYCHTHVWQPLDEVALHESVRVVIPIRPPYLSYLTRRYRLGAATDSVETKQKKVALHWKELIRKAKYMNPLFVPVEEDLDRRQLLQTIANHLDAPIVNQERFEKFVTDWPKVCTAGPREERDEYESSGLIDEVTPTFLDFAVIWYQGVVLELKDVHLFLD